MNSILYCLRQGLANIRRNKLFSLASVVTIAACIFLLGVFYFLIADIEETARNAEENIGITVFFDDNLDEDAIHALGDQIAADSRVAYMVYTSPEEAWENYKAVYFEGMEELADGFSDDNPLAHSASYEIHLKDVADQADFVKQLEAMDGVGKVNYSELAAGGLAGFNRLLGYTSAILVAILVMVSLLLISNTIKLAYTVRKEEVELTKYIGATNAFVMAPFIVEGVVLGLIGSAIPLALLYVVYRLAVETIESKFQVLVQVLVFLPASDIFRILVPVALALGIGIGFVGSSVEISKNLKV